MDFDNRDQQPRPSLLHEIAGIGGSDDDGSSPDPQGGGWHSSGLFGRYPGELSVDGDFDLPAGKPATAPLNPIRWYDDGSDSPLPRNTGLASVGGFVAPGEAGAPALTEASFAVPSGRSANQSEPASSSGHDHRNPILDGLGKLWSLPNTALGLAAAGASYAAGKIAGTNPRFQIGDNAIQLVNSPLNINHRAYTLGNVQVYGTGQGPDQRGESYTGVKVRNGAHEAGHSYQAQALGPFFLPAEILGALQDDKNPLEVGADKFATGKSWSGF